MRHRRRISHSTVIAFAVAAATTLVLTTSVTTPEETVVPSVNRFEHEARRHLSNTQADQARVLKPGEHLARRPLAEAQPPRSINHLEHLAHRDASSAAGGEGVVLSANRPGECSDSLAQAWRNLGHFSDGYESYLLRQPPCR